MQIQKLSNSQNNLEKEEHSWRNHTPWLQTILQSYSNQDGMVLARKLTYRPVGQEREPRDKPTHLWPITYDKESKNMQWRKDSLLKSGTKKNWTATCRRMKLELSLTPYTKINSNWIKDLNVKPDTIKLLEKNLEHWQIPPLFFWIYLLKKIKAKINK